MIDQEHWLFNFILEALTVSELGIIGKYNESLNRFVLSIPLPKFKVNMGDIRPGISFFTEDIQKRINNILEKLIEERFKRISNYCLELPDDVTLRKLHEELRALEKNIIAKGGLPLNKEIARRFKIEFFSPEVRKDNVN